MRVDEKYLWKVVEFVGTDLVHGIMNKSVPSELTRLPEPFVVKEDVGGIGCAEVVEDISIESWERGQKLFGPEPVQDVESCVLPHISFESKSWSAVDAKNSVVFIY